MQSAGQVGLQFDSIQLVLLLGLGGHQNLGAITVQLLDLDLMLRDAVNTVSTIKVSGPTSTKLSDVI